MDQHEPMLDCSLKQTDNFLSDVLVDDWGLIDYRQALQRQLDLVDLVSREHSREKLIFCTHPPVVTLGRATDRAVDLTGWSGELVEVSRGGRATYHGPSQLVIYPILDLNRRGRDIHKYLRFLETLVIQTLRGLGIESKSRPEALGDDTDPSLQLTGVWVGSRKVASIGIAIRKWITYHGIAINVAHDPEAFAGIRPCGFQPGTPISVEELIGRAVDLAEVKKSMLELIGS